MIRTYQTKPLNLAFAFFVSLLLPVTLATAEGGKSGLSATKLKLPSGGGSIGGVGENAQVQFNMGSVNYPVKVVLPEGHAGLTPSLSLSYSSGSGNGVVGLGWSLGKMRVERMTSKGLPGYDEEDVFAAGGGAELVRVNDETRVYRARMEGGFVRYSWLSLVGEEAHERNRKGYWKAEFPDGRVAYFGASASGEEVPEARIEGEREGGISGTFAYYVVEMEDVHGHHIRYDYEKDAEQPYLTEVSWAFSEDGRPRYRAALSYENREDWLVDGKAGALVVQSKRLTEIEVLVRGVQLRRYVLSYEPYEESGGLSRLSSVHQYGMDMEEAYPVVFSFDYTTPSLPNCDEVGVCRGLSLTNLGALGLDFRTGDADLIDINGDGLPDVVGTRDGVHTHYKQGVREDGEIGLLEGEQSQVEDGGVMRLSSPNVQMVDLNGDGHSDMVSSSALSQALWNRGEGDWSEREELFDAHIPDLSQDANLKFLDVDHDRSIDAVHIGRDAVWYFKNDGLGVFEENETLVLEGVGVSFVDDRVQLSDMNGDGMADLVQMLPGSDRLVVRANLGYGRFSEAQEMTGLPEDLDPALTDLVDINGDGLSDVVEVRGDEVRLCINRDGHVFSEMRRITELQNGAALPSRGAEVSIRYADMNGSGTKDIVWLGATDAGASGQVRYLELFSEKPNLLKEVRNGIGKVIRFSYGTSTSHMLRDGGPDAWRYRLPFPVQTLEHVETWSTLSPEVRQIQQVHYRHGYYDGEEKQFHGFEEVEMFAFGDESIEPGRTHYQFDVGAEDLYRKGLTLRTELYSDERAISETRNTYEDCPLEPMVEEEPGALTPAVRWICQTQTDTVLKEGQEENAWVTLRKRMHHDGYGNTTWGFNDGVIGMGPDGQGACTPCEDVQGGGAGQAEELQGGACGPECLGDEQIEEAAFISPEDVVAEQGEAQPRWMLRVPYLKRNHGSTEEDNLFTEEQLYYDGEGEDALPLGEVSRGLLRTTETKTEVDENTYASSGRIDYDAHGNPIRTFDALGRQMRFGYDEEGLLLTLEAFVLDGEDREERYEMQQTVSYHPVLEVVTTSRSWQKVVGGQPVSGGHLSAYSYDTFGRLTSIAHPGDTLESPTQVFEYTLASPMSHIVTRARSEEGGAFDLASMECFDGLGQKVQSVTKTEEGRYLTDGWILYNAQGKPRATHQPYEKPELSCDHTPPEEGAAAQRITTITMDATARALVTTLPDGDIYGTASFSEVQHLPLQTRAFDSEDTDPESPFFQTPLTTRTDGLGRTTQVERLLEADGAPIITKMRYDGLGRIAELIDDAGNTKRQSYDLRGRIIRVEDPNSGTLTMQYNDVGELISSTDALGQTIRSTYDEAGRMTLQYQVGEDGEPLPYTRTEWHYDESPLCAPQDCTHAEGKLVAVKYPLLVDARFGGQGEVDEAEVDGRGEEARDAWGIDTSGYDMRDRVVRMSRSRLGRDFVFRTEYDSAGRATRITYPTGQVIEPEYDAAGRVRSIPGYLSASAYNSQGLLSSLTLGNNITQSHTYDALLRNVQTRTTNQAGTVLQGHRFELSRTSQIEAIHDQRPAHGHMEHPELPSATAFFEYDALQRLTDAHMDPGHPKEESMHYRYSRIDNILDKRSTLAEQSPAHVGQMQYGQTEANHPAGPHALTRAGNMLFQYDGKGQMIQKTLFQEEGEAAQMHYRWDAHGRLREVQKSQGNAEAVEGAEAEEGNAEEEMRETQARFYYDVSGERTLKFERSESGAFSRTDYLTPDFELRDGVATLYIRHQGGRIAKTESTQLMPMLLSDLAPLIEQENGQEEGQEGQRVLVSAPDDSITAADAWVSHAHVQNYQRLQAAPSTSAETLLHASVKRLIAAPSDVEPEVQGQEAEEQNGAFEARARTTFFHNNHLMSTTLSTDQEGNILQENLHYPYGQIRYQSAHLPDYSFTDKERDRATGFTYHSARYYNPLTARWVSPDPLFTTLGDITNKNSTEALNPYRYTENSPLQHIDPTGNIPVFLAFLAVKVIAFGVAYVGTKIATSAAGTTMSPERRQRMNREVNQALATVAKVQASQVFGAAAGATGRRFSHVMGISRPLASIRPAQMARALNTSANTAASVRNRLNRDHSQQYPPSSATNLDETELPHLVIRNESFNPTLEEFVGPIQQEEFVGPIQPETNPGRSRRRTSRRSVSRGNHNTQQEPEYAHPDEYSESYLQNDDQYLEPDEGQIIDAGGGQCGVDYHCGF